MAVDLDALRTGPEPWWTTQSRAEYQVEWYLWRALLRDDRLTEAEGWARYDVLVKALTRDVAPRS
ncbi:hypothetical protein [Kitasatospora cineracea]|uniref:hypothetical protein n=1 Tax=Kitasatospora cineracea TaxID=88074 RepID=UPI0036A208BF